MNIGDRALTIQLQGTILVMSSVWKRNGHRYTGLHELRETFGIKPLTDGNLDAYEWLNVIKKTHQVNQPLHCVQQEGV